MGLFNFVFFVKTCQSTLAIIAEIAYIASYNNLHDSTTSSEAEALFGLSIVCLFWEMLTMLAIYVEYGDRLRRRPGGSGRRGCCQKRLRSRANHGILSE